MELKRIVLQADRRYTLAGRRLAEIAPKRHVIVDGDGLIFASIDRSGVKVNEKVRDLGTEALAALASVLRIGQADLDQVMQCSTE